MQQRRSPEKREYQEEPQEHPAKEVGKTATTSTVEIDDILDELDATLEENDTSKLEEALDEIDEMFREINAEEMVINYRQQGGQ